MSPTPISILIDRIFNMLFSKIPKFFSKIEIKLTLIVFIIGTIPLFISSLTAYELAKIDLTDQAFETLSSVSKAQEGVLLAYINSLKIRTVDFSSDGFIRDATEDIIKGRGGRELVEQLNTHLIVNKKALDKTIYGINILDLDGIIIASTDDGEIGKDESQDEYFTRAIKRKKGAIFIEDTHESYHFGISGHSISIAAPLFDKETGEIVGVLANYYKINLFSDILTGKYQQALGSVTSFKARGESLDIYLVDNHKGLLSKSDFLDEEYSLGEIINTKPVNSCLDHKKEISGIWINPKGDAVYGASSCIQEFDWTLLVEVEEEEILQSIVDLRNKGIATFFFSVFFIMVFTYFFFRRSIEPLRLLLTASKKVKSGDLTARVNFHSKDELGLLVENFNQMIKELKTKRDNLINKNRELKKSKNAHVEAQKLAHIGNWELDLVKNKLIWSDEIYRIFGLKPQEFGATYEAFLETIHPEDRAHVDKVYTESVENNTPYEVTHRIVRPGGEVRHVHEKSEDIKNSKGKTIRSLGTVQDITEVVEAEKALRESDRMKTEFISIASHQLRTPLVSINWLVNRLLKKGKFSETERSYLTDMSKSVKRLTDLVGLLLNTTNIEKGISPSSISVVDIVKLTKDYVEEYDPAAKEGGLSLILENSPKELEVTINEYFFGNIIENLISNAINYTPPGGEIKISLEKKGENFLIVVEDNGIGIPKKEQDTILDKFTRGSNAKLISTSGTGLGLYLVNKATILLGGKIWFDSKEDKGTTFYVEIPLIAPHKKETKKQNT